MSEQTHAFIFFGVYLLIVGGCVLAVCVDNGWRPEAVIIGLVWGLLCLPGWIFIYSLLAEGRNK